MEKIRNSLILLILVILLIFLIILCYMKYKPQEQVKVSNTDYVEQVQIPNKNQEEEVSEPVIDSSIYEKLYDAVSITNAATECLDYYLQDKITIDTMSDELLSYLLIKNTSFETVEVEEEKIIDTMLSLFGKEIHKDNFAGNVEDYNYLLMYNDQVSTYSITLNKAQKKNYTLQSSILSHGNEADTLFIIESYTLDLDGDIKEGKIKYVFKKDGNSDNYFFERVEKV